MLRYFLFCLYQILFSTVTGFLIQYIIFYDSKMLSSDSTFLIAIAQCPCPLANYWSMLIGYGDWTTGVTCLSCDHFLMWRLKLEAWDWATAGWLKVEVEKTVCCMVVVVEIVDYFLVCCPEFQINFSFVRNWNLTWMVDGVFIILDIMSLKLSVHWLFS